MKKKLLLVSCLVLGVLCALRAVPMDFVGEDSAAQSEYKDGWGTGKNGGEGFGPWRQETKTDGGQDSYAGMYLATTKEKPDLNGIATENKAFGFYANGTGLESAVAFRAFGRPLKPGQAFSFLMEHGAYVKKYGSDSPAGATVGAALLTDPNVGGADDYNKGARFEFGYSSADGGYVVRDGDGVKKLDVPFTDSGLAVTFSLLTPDTYGLEVTVLAKKQNFRVSGRKLAGKPGAIINGFSVFDRNGETNDVYFNGFQILQKP